MNNLSRRAVLAASLAAAFVPRRARAAAAPTVGCDARWEWLSALARAAGFEEYQGGLAEWTGPLDTRLARLRSHPVVSRLRRARDASGVSYDALPSLALHLVPGADGGPPTAWSLAVAATPWPSGLDVRWQGVDLAALLRELGSAAKKAGFAELWSGSGALRARAEAAAASAATALDLGWYEAFCGFPTPGAVRVVPALGSRPSNYAARRHGIDPEIAAFLAVSSTDAGLEVDASVLVHEIGHAFVNPLVSENRAVLEPPGQRVYAAVKERMDASAYGAWDTVVVESVLRAVTVRYAEAHGGPAAARSELARHLDRGFPWTVVLADSMRDYEADRARYATLGEWSVPLAAVLTVIAEEEEARAAGRPHVVSISVADGADDVDPALPALVVVFDRPMRDRSWSVVGDPAEMPDGDTPHYEEGGTRFVMPWRLSPGRSYRLGLNGGRSRAFQSAEGVPLEPVLLRFRTRG